MKHTAAFLTIAFLFQLIHEVPPRMSKAWLFTTESCPLKFSSSEESENVLVVNRSPARVVSYRIGCVEPANKPHRVGRYERVNNVVIPPGQAQISTIASYSRTYRECLKTRGSVGIVFVDFEDGGFWKLAQ